MKREPFVTTDESYMMLQDWQSFDRNLLAGITTRHSGLAAPLQRSFNLALHVGDSSENVVENREHLSQLLDVQLNQWVCAEQVHGSSIQKVDDDDMGKGACTLQTAVGQTDGLYTTRRGIFLTMFFADCVPLFFYAPNKGVTGLAHAGWRGTVADIAGKMVRKWQDEEGIDPGEVHAAIGPSIGKCCYEVDRNVISQVDRVLEQNDPKPYEQNDEHHFQLDLRNMNRLLLSKAGVPDQQIEQTAYCTGCNHNLFFSHRIEQGNTGRIMAFISLT